MLPERSIIIIIIITHTHNTEKHTHTRARAPIGSKLQSRTCQSTNGMAGCTAPHAAKASTGHTVARSTWHVHAQGWAVIVPSARTSGFVGHALTWPVRF